MQLMGGVDDCLLVQVNRRIGINAGHLNYSRFLKYFLPSQRSFFVLERATTEHLPMSYTLGTLASPARQTTTTKKKFAVPPVKVACLAWYRI